ncbi:MAG: hypothetical protein BWZ02_00555 [Lentisphaerae bacterium ADurb.BinA184]|nr:MAG: hypothetical protein BWZ02_00555 [Lentisphaerae bacterium ADurb.BinA184]
MHLPCGLRNPARIAPAGGGLALLRGRAIFLFVCRDAIAIGRRQQGMTEVQQPAVKTFSFRQQGGHVLLLRVD